MTARQFYNYRAKQILQNSEPSQVAAGQVIAQEACNIVYPDDIEAALASTTICSSIRGLVRGFTPRQHGGSALDPDATSDISAATGIVTTNPGSSAVVRSSTVMSMSNRSNTTTPLSIDTLLVDAPKLKQLSTFITLLRDKRHVVYTRYAHHYGGQLISYLLNRFVGTDVYECYTLEQQDAVMDKFNKSPTQGGIIVTTLTLDMAKRPLNVDYLHLVDGSLSKVETIISNIYKYRNYSGVEMPPVLQVHSYICVIQVLKRHL